MRKITENSVRAFLRNEKFNSQNMAVVIDGSVCDMRLHGNLIARMDINTRDIKIFDGGWQSVTTKERLNGLLSYANTNKQIFQKDWAWYIRDTKTNEVVGFSNGYTF